MGAGPRAESRRRRPRPGSLFTHATDASRPARATVDENLAIAGHLLDFAASQPSEARQLAYRRAAYAILELPVPVSDLAARGTLQNVRFVGPATARIVGDLLAGRTHTVDDAVAASPQRSVIAARQKLREAFLSRAAAERVLDVADDSAVSMTDYRGDLQMHSTWSDGRQSLDEIVATCRSLGYRYAGVTDHSYGLAIAGGLTIAELKRQHETIDRIDAGQGGSFRLFKGIEANISSEGTLDLTEDERRLCEFVVAAPHSALRSSADQTRRMVAAVRHPFVHVLGHPRGRRYNTRPGVSADWPTVFAAAAEHEVAIEIDGYADRQDVDFQLAAEALAAGCLFALDSDAHATHEFAHVRMAVAHARLAGIPADRILNCWPVERLAAWFAAHA